MSEVKCKLRDSAFLVECKDYGKYSEYEDELFAIFLQLYEHGTLVYNGKIVRMKHYPPDYGEKTGFYHMICENYQHTGDENDRKPNFRRCERIKWPKEIIEKCAEHCERIMIWENQRHGKQNILLYCPELDYLVVFGKRNNYLLLTTAYPVDYPNKRNDLIKEYNEYKNKQRTSV